MGYEWLSASGLTVTRFLTNNSKRTIGRAESSTGILLFFSAAFGAPAGVIA